MTQIRDLRALFTDPFYFGCEADDRMVSVAFNRRLNPLGAVLKPVFGSDIGHWDVLDAKSVLTEAWGLVNAKLLTPDNFRDLTFANPAMMHLSMNPDYFKGTSSRTLRRRCSKRRQEPGLPPKRFHTCAYGQQKQERQTQADFGAK